VRRITCLLEPVGLGRHDRVDEPELVDQEDRAARPGHARELGDDELRASRVMKDAQASRDVERPVLVGQGRRVPDDELAVLRRPLVARCDHLG